MLACSIFLQEKKERSKPQPTAKIVEDADDLDFQFDEEIATKPGTRPPANDAEE